jgi:hypothetical protein
MEHWFSFFWIDVKYQVGTWTWDTTLEKCLQVQVRAWKPIQQKQEPTLSRSATIYLGHKLAILSLSPNWLYMKYQSFVVLWSIFLEIKRSIIHPGGRPIMENWNVIFRLRSSIVIRGMAAWWSILGARDESSYLLWCLNTSIEQMTEQIEHRSDVFLDLLLASDDHARERHCFVRFVFRETKWSLVICGMINTPSVSKQMWD